MALFDHFCPIGRLLDKLPPVPSPPPATMRIPGMLAWHAAARAAYYDAAPLPADDWFDERGAQWRDLSAATDAGIVFG